MHVGYRCLSRFWIWKAFIANSPEAGIGRKQDTIGLFDFYGCFSGKTILLSYGSRLVQEIDAIRNFFAAGGDLHTFREWLRHRLGVESHVDYKYYLSHLIDVDTSQVRQLNLQDYPAYLEFFQTQYPDSEAETWLEAYFRKMVEQGSVFGIFADGKLVSATDTPDMPYMKDALVEIGINTLPEYRNRGYATAVVVALIRKLIAEGKVPIVSCTASNLISQRLAEKIGFRKLADVITFSLG